MLHECIVDQGPIAAVASDHDHSLRGQVRPAHALSFRERMVLAAREHKGVIHQLRELDIGMRGSDEIDAEIRFAARYRLQAFVRSNIENPNANPGICVAKSRDRERQKIEHGRGHRSDCDEPELRAPISRIASTDVSYSSMSRRILGRKSRPTMVSFTWRVDRSSSGAPRLSSSFWMRRLSAG